MSLEDQLYRFIFDEFPIRGEFIRLEESFQTIIGQHDYPEVLRRLLGEALAVAGLLGAIIKFDGRLTVQYRGNGKLKLLLAQCNNQYQLRGLIKWDGELSYEEIMEEFNHGVLVIMIDMGMAKGRYQGVVSWRGNSLAESIEGYFKDSEQLNTKLWLHVNETTVSGLLLQAIPEPDKIEVPFDPATSAKWDRVISLTNNMTEMDLSVLSFEGLLKTLYPHDDIRLFPAMDVAFGCACSRKRGAEALLILGKEEAEAELADKNSIAVTCDFCNNEYIFDRVDVSNIFEEDERRPPDSSLH